MPSDAPRRPAVYAHRGGRGHPENSLAAVRAAAAAGADGVEIDVQVDPDGAVVVGHDPIDWERDDPGDLLGLAELLAVVDELGLDLVIDVKSTGHPDREAGSLARGLARAERPEAVTVSSFSVPVLQALRPQVPNLTLMPIVSLRRNFPGSRELEDWPGRSVLAAALLHPHHLTHLRRRSATTLVWFAATEWPWLIRLVARGGADALIVSDVAGTRRLIDG